MSLRRRLGALAYDWPRFLRHVGGDWRLIHNRRETIESDGRGVRCCWEYGSDLHLPKVYPFAGRWLMRRAFRDHRLSFRGEPPSVIGRPQVSFVIGHRGVERLPQLQTTLRSIASQTAVGVECIVVEQSARPEIRSELPAWVTYLHTTVDPGLDYCRAAAFNAGARIARGDLLVLHDNDILVPECYAAEMIARAHEGWDFVDAKRFLFYMEEDETLRLVGGEHFATRAPATVVQNVHGGSIAATRKAYFDIGGFDEEFVGWGGEDLEFWERALAGGRTYAFGYLPLVHLWHPAQKGRAQPDAPAVQRYYEVRDTPPKERIKRLRQREQESGTGST